MDDYSKFRLNSLDEINILRSKCGERSFELYKHSVLCALLKLKKGERITIHKMVKKANIELFIKIGCEFILSHPDYEFSNDFTYIKRI